MELAIEDGLRRVSGRVKWFDPTKGFGFVVAENGGPDILLHANVLRNYGQSSVADGVLIELSVQETAKGVQAAEVIEIWMENDHQSPPLEDFIDFPIEEIKAAPLVAARVKWFDKVKGFGFANAYGNSDDIFVHVEVLRRSGLANLMPGEAISVRIMDGRRGKMAAEVCAWEAGLQTE
ncbi:MAG: cold shock domain-containing protein [Paracoccaceae bacterium]|jgi:cold shock protein|nr:cold shock domain-containing protein [Paracoccaceae bacterium]